MFKFALVIVFLLTFGFSADDEKTYVFKAKGKFAQELKELMKKHAQDGDIEIQEVQNKRSFGQQATSIVDSFLNNEELSGDIAYGKQIYDKTCYRCHGKQAEKSTYASVRSLNTLSKEELYESLHSYKTDALYGGSNKFIMREQAVGMTTPEMVSVSAYIYSLSHSKKEATRPIGKKSTNTEEQVQGTYLK